MLIKVKGYLGIKGNEKADRVAKNNTEKSTCIKIKDVQQKDLTYDIYWNVHRSIFSNPTDMVEIEVTWVLFKKNTGFNCITSTTNNKFIKHLKLTNCLLPTLEIMKERRYDLYGDIKCRVCYEKNEDDNHIIYCQQLKEKWLTVANNTMCKHDQILKEFLSQEKHIQLNQEDIQ
ncbi:hypothetical protein GLOIN_2v1870151 [Rhizophagus clarus]|uniref:Uncharacterized protein n=1 Tax=Rhizophagus clarus TaxID=94130 RepID=A0A8H3LQQ3_9GLOM|nr:hypothetical protein GLOIN_2v1870151 [Rhizophagus clarus]